MEQEIDKEIADLVVARLQTLPDNVEISIGSSGAYTKNDLIAHVREGDEIGQKMVEVEMSFLRSLKDGIFYGDDIVSNEA